MNENQKNQAVRVYSEKVIKLLSEGFTDEHGIVGRIPDVAASLKFWAEQTLEMVKEITLHDLQFHGVFEAFNPETSDPTYAFNFTLVFLDKDKADMTIMLPR